jgi:hypothetical protein
VRELGIGSSRDVGIPLLSQLACILEIEDSRSGLPRIVPGSAGLDLEGMRKILLSLVAGIALLVTPAISQAASKVTYKASQ